MDADGREKVPDSLNEGLDGIVPEVSYAILTVGNEVDAPPDHK